MEGAELHDILHIKRRLPEQDCFPVMLQILRAAEYLHSINIIHRDLKPRNVLVSSRLRLHVIDLGLAIDLSDPLDHRTAQLGVVGTQGYMAPESLMSAPVTALVDIWAIGVMLYEMVFGFSPFLPHELFLPTGPEFPDESWGISASAELKDLINRLLEKKPENRLSSVCGGFVWVVYGVRRREGGGELASKRERRREREEGGRDRQRQRQIH